MKHEAGGSLVEALMYYEQDVRKIIPIPDVLIYHMPQHPLQGLVNAFEKTISLGMIH